MGITHIFSIIALYQLNDHSLQPLPRKLVAFQSNNNNNNKDDDEGLHLSRKQQTCSQLHSAKRMPPQELRLQRPAPHQQSLPWRGELCYKTTTIGLDKYLYPPPLCQRPWRQEILLLRQQTVNEVQSGTYLNSRKRLFFLQPTFSGGSSPTSRALFASQSPLFGLECWERKSLAITLS